MKNSSRYCAVVVFFIPALACAQLLNANSVYRAELLGLGYSTRPVDGVAVVEAPITCMKAAYRDTQPAEGLPLEEKLVTYSCRIQKKDGKMAYYAFRGLPEQDIFEELVKAGARTRDGKTRDADTVSLDGLMRCEFENELTGCTVHVRSTP